MESATRRNLAEFLRSEGMSLADDQQRVRALLLDTCPDSKTEIGLLTLAIEDDIPLRLVRSSADAVMKDGAIARAIDDFQTARRVDRNAAEWVVGSWAWALGLSNTEPQDGPGDQHDSAASATGMPGAAKDPEPGAPGSSAGSEGQDSGGLGPDVIAPSSAAASEEGVSPPAPHLPGSSTGSWPPEQAGGACPPGSYSPGSRGGPWPTPGYSMPPSGGDSWPPGWVGGPYPPPPPPGPSKKSWLLPLLIAGSAVAMLVLVVGLVVVVSTIVDPSPPPSPSPSTLSTTEQAGVTITATVGSAVTSDRVTVFLEGRKVGELFVDQSRRSHRITFTIPVGDYNYQLYAYYTYTDSYGDARTGSISGRGSIAVTDGVVFEVAVVGSGENAEVTLHEAS